MPRRLVCLVHGGAGAIPDSGVGPAIDGTGAAAKAGLAALLGGGTAVDAVEAAVRCLEDNPRFNAGTGSVLTRAGNVEMDCLLQEGKDLRAGTASGVTNVKNPVSLARKILESSPHVFLSGKTAETFAVQTGLKIVANESLITEARREQLARTLAATAGQTRMVSDPLSVLDASTSAADMDKCVKESLAMGAAAMPAPGTIDMAPPGSVAAREGVDAGDHDTVGAVAIDCEGNVACATSTGGLTGKWPGRVGDTPVLGSGGCADNETGAVSTTGTGEFIMRYQLARRVCEAYARLKAAGAEPSMLASLAVEDALHGMAVRMRDPGEGVIFVDAEGNIGVGHTSHRMSYAWAAAEVPEGTATGHAATPLSTAVSGGVQLLERSRAGVRVVEPAVQS